MKSLLLLLTAFAGLSNLHAHIGSPNIILEGRAGEYQVLVNIMPPEVVPGLAQISVRVPEEGVSGVAIQGIYFRNGSEGAPPPEALKVMPDDPAMYTGQIWLMEYGSASVKVIVNGLKGTGSTVVPIPSLALAEPDMPPGLMIGLGIMGLILFVGMMTLIYASVGEALTSAGEPISGRRQRKAWAVAGITGLILIGVLWFGKNWWTAEERQYRRRMFQAIPFQTDLRIEQQQRILTIDLSDPQWYDRKPGDLVPDHGKYMHAFLIGRQTRDEFAHLHPIRLDSTIYEVQLPPQAPAGAYDLFVDIVHQSGLSETLFETLAVPPPPGAAVPMKVGETPARQDPDDSWYVYSDPKGLTQHIETGIDVTWIRDLSQPIKANQLQSLAFEVTSTENGLPIPLEPYLGMLGHAAVVKEDASVFIHLHPVGTISMAAQEAFANRINDDVITICAPLDSISEAARQLILKDPRATTSMQAEIEKAMKNSGLTHRVSFPYAFPEPGKYRMWVQMRIQEKIRTAAFDVQVAE